MWLAAVHWLAEGLKPRLFFQLAAPNAGRSASGPPRAAPAERKKTDSTRPKVLSLPTYLDTYVAELASLRADSRCRRPSALATARIGGQTASRRELLLLTSSVRSTWYSVLRMLVAVGAREALPPVSPPPLPRVNIFFWCQAKEKRAWQY